MDRQMVAGGDDDEGLDGADVPYEPEVALFGGLAVQSRRPAEADVIAVLRDGVG